MWYVRKICFVDGLNRHQYCVVCPLVAVSLLLNLTVANVTIPIYSTERRIHNMELLNRLPMPDGMDKSQVLEVILNEEYGFLPVSPDSIKAEVVDEKTGIFDSKAVWRKINLTAEAAFGTFTFPVYELCPAKVLVTNAKTVGVHEAKGVAVNDATNEAVPCFILIDYGPCQPDNARHLEPVIDAGCAVISFAAGDVSSDDGDFTNGLAGVIYKEGRRESNQCGKLGLWAWGAMRVLDYALTLPYINPARIGVVGHSRLGKAAVLAGAVEERFYCAFSNNSGCGGAALARESTGETVGHINRKFPFWFCENYVKYIDNEDAMPFDQHYVLAANYPHKVYVASAANDGWSCPKNEYLSCVAASRFYEAQGVNGFLHPGRLPEVGECFSEGNIGYHLRDGGHAMTDVDWQYYVRFQQNI